MRCLLHKATAVGDGVVNVKVDVNANVCVCYQTPPAARILYELRGCGKDGCKAEHLVEPKTNKTPPISKSRIRNQALADQSNARMAQYRAQVLHSVRG